MHKKVAIIILILCFFLFSCTKKAPNEDILKQYSTEFFAMDTVIQLTLYAENDELGKKALKLAENEFLRIAELCESYGENLIEPSKSTVWRINNANGVPCEVEEEIFLLIKKALTVSALADDAFDIAMGRLINLWNIRGGGYLPTTQEVQEVLPQIGSQKVLLNEDNNTVQLLDGVQLDLGGIAKGYAVDCMATVLKKSGIKHALINAGGNVLAVGSKPDGSFWQVGIRNPEHSNEIVAVLSLSDQAAVTSSVDQRFFEKDGVRYHHILDPYSGYPANKCISATAICDNSTDADLLSTTLFVLGENGTKKFTDNLPEFEMLMIDNNFDIIMTDGLQNSINLMIKQEVHQ